MKNRLHIYITFFVIIIILVSLVISLFFLLPKISEKKRNLYVEYINSILPNPYDENVKVLTGRENIARISQSIVTYYNACNKENIELVKDILNKEYINYMNINVNELVSSNDVTTIDASSLEITTIYKVGDNIFFATLNDQTNIYYVGILLNVDTQKYSIIFDGVYNNNDAKKYEMDYQVEGVNEVENQGESQNQ